MSKKIDKEMEKLADARPAELRAKYEEVLGEPTRAPNRAFLLRRIREGLAGKVELRPQSPRWAHIEYLLALWGPEAGHAAIQEVHAGGRYADWVRAFAETPHEPRALRHGDEATWARRRGKAAERRQLPVIADA